MKPPKHEVHPSTRFDYKPHLLLNEEGNYVVDPAHYVSASQLSWNAMLKQTPVILELITDPDL